MSSALKKVDTALSERYDIICDTCQYLREFFGTEKDARMSAERMGWGFEIRTMKSAGKQIGLNEWEAIEFDLEVAYCPHHNVLADKNLAIDLPVRSKFGNPVWGHDALTVSSDIRLGRREGMQEALRLLLGPAILTNNAQFQTGLDASIDLLNRRLSEL